jgi:hypothetical protein
VITLGSVGYSPTGALAGLNVTVSSAAGAGGSLDSSGTLTTMIAESMTQFGTATVSSSLSGVIDVAAERKVFTPTGTDSMSFTVTGPSTTDWLNLATLNSDNGTVFTLTGESGKMTGLLSTNYSTSGTSTLAFTEDTPALTASYSDLIESDSLTFTPPGDVVLFAQTFTASVVFNYTSVAGTAGTTTAASGLAAGSWTLNGATVVVPYIPYSSNASQILYITNTGTTTGDVLVTAKDTSGNSYDLGVVGSLPGGNLLKLATLIKRGLEATGFTSGKLTITIVAQVPKADIIVYASYNIGGSDRGFINTSQYLSND